MMHLSALQYYDLELEELKSHRMCPMSFHLPPLLYISQHIPLNLATQTILIAICSPPVKVYSIIACCSWPCYGMPS